MVLAFRTYPITFFHHVFWQVIWFRTMTFKTTITVGITMMCTLWTIPISFFEEHVLERFKIFFLQDYTNWGS